jgi:hypothetical protein
VKWREVIERAGGVGSAMLYGEPLKQLVAELDEWPPKVEAADQRARIAAEDSAKAGLRALEAEKLLEAERAELNRRVEAQDPLIAQVKELQRKLAILRWYEPNLERVATEAWLRAHPEEVTV